VVFRRGGNWNNGTNAGALSLNLNNSSTNTNNNTGFRCVVVFPLYKKGYFRVCMFVVLFLNMQSKYLKTTSIEDPDCI
jgi:hypothetical protein